MLVVETISSLCVLHKIKELTYFIPCRITFLKSINNVLIRAETKNMTNHLLPLPAGSVSGKLKGPHPEEPQLSPHCAGGSEPGCQDCLLNVAQYGR